MTVAIPSVNKPEDIPRILAKIAATPVPEKAVTAECIRSLGISLASSRQLRTLLQVLGFLDEDYKPTTAWISYNSGENANKVLGFAIQSAYTDLFKAMFCPYLEDDENLLDYFKRNTEASPREIEDMLATFRYLAESADFQDLLYEGGTFEDEKAEGARLPLPEVKVNPNLPWTIQVHIDPNTSDQKIETIFKYMRKYLLGKD